MVVGCVLGMTRRPFVALPGVPVSAVSLAASLGASRPRVPLGVRQDLALQFAAIRSLHSLRLPPVW